MTSPAPRRGEAATELREKVAETLWQQTHDGILCEQEAGFQTFWLGVADAVLALPEVAELRGQVERVQALADSWDKQAARYRNEHLAPPARALREHAAHLRAALASSSATEPESAGQEVRGG